MTLVVLLHPLRHRQFKCDDTDYVCRYLRAPFSGLSSHGRVIERLPRCAPALSALLPQLQGRCTGLSIVDATPVAVCHTLRIRQHRVLHNIAARGKSSTGWFYGMKLHLVINHPGEMLAMKVTSGNTNGRKPVPFMCAGLSGRRYGDKCDISQALRQKLHMTSVDRITKVRKNRKPVIHGGFDQVILKRRSLVETVIDALKNLCQIEHTRYRSVANFMVNRAGGVIAYCFIPNKPRLPVSQAEMAGTGAALIPN